MQDFDTVDSQGNIWFVRGEGILVSFREIDDTNNPVDPGTHPRWLNIPALGIKQEIGVSPSLSTDWRFVLTPLQLQPIPRVGSVVFSVTDEQGVVPQSLWSGVIRERNLYE